MYYKYPNEYFFSVVKIKDLDFVQMTEMRELDLSEDIIDNRIVDYDIDSKILEEIDNEYVDENAEEDEVE